MSRNNNNILYYGLLLTQGMRNVEKMLSRDAHYGEAMMFWWDWHYNFRATFAQTIFFSRARSHNAPNTRNKPFRAPDFIIFVEQRNGVPHNNIFTSWYNGAPVIRRQLKSHLGVWKRQNCMTRLQCD